MGMNWKIERKQLVVVVLSALLAGTSYFIPLPEQPLRRSVTGAGGGSVTPAQPVTPRNLVIEPRLLALPPLLTAAEPLPAVKPATAVTRQAAIELSTGPAEPSKQTPLTAPPIAEQLSAKDFLRDTIRPADAGTPLSPVSQNSQLLQKNSIPSQ